MDVFISYSSGESLLARTIKHALDKVGVESWFAEYSIGYGEKFPKEIMDGIMKSRCMIVIVSKNSDASGQVENEIANFGKKENAAIIPYVIDNNQKETLFNTSTHHRINATADPFGRFDELIAAVYNKLGREILPEHKKLVHQVAHLNNLKPIKKIAGKIAFFIFMFELLLISLYAAMNISLYFLIPCAGVMFVAVVHPLRQRSRCAYAGCPKKAEAEPTAVILKSKYEKALFLCSEHKYTFDMVQARKTNRVGIVGISFVGIIILAVLMCFAAVRYNIAPSMLVTVSSSFDFISQTQADVETAELMGRSICAQSENTMCILNDGTVYIYDGSAYADEHIAGWDGITALTASDSHVAAIRFDGTVLSAGENEYGECDIDSLNVDDIKSLEAGGNFTVVLTEDGRVYGIGKNDDGQIDVDDLSGIAQISAGAAHTLALFSDGTVAASGNNDYTQCDVLEWTEIVQVSAGANISAGLRRDGTVVTTSGDVEWTDIVQVSAGDSLIAGLTKHGTVLLAGDDTRIGEVSEWQDIIAVDVSGTHIIGVTDDDTLVDASLLGSGYVDEDIKNIGALPNSDASVLYYMKKLAACESFALTLGDDMIQASGRVPDFEFVGFNNIVQIKANSNMAVGLKNDGTAVASRVEGAEAFSLSDWAGLTMIDMAQRHTVGLKSDGRVVVAGDNTCGQSDVSEFGDIIYISAAGKHTVAVQKDGCVVAVGDNGDGQCNVQEMTGIKMVDTGAYHTAAVRYDGTVAAVGRNDWGQCDVADWTDIVSVAVGDGFTIGLKRDGSVVTVGDIDISAYDITNDIVAVDAVGEAYVMMRQDGVLYDAFVAKQEDN